MEEVLGVCSGSGGRGIGDVIWCLGGVFGWFPVEDVLGIEGSLREGCTGDRRMCWSFWRDLELMRALAGARHGKREPVLLSGGVPTEGGWLAGVSSPEQEAQGLSSGLELGV